MEIVYKDEKKQTEDKKIDILPKNIRQIGEPDHRLKLYMEDFVSTYLQKTAGYKPELNRVCMLYGVEREKNGHPVLFVQSAARIELTGAMKADSMQEPDWKAAEGIRRKYFPGQKVLGWAVMSGNQGTLGLEQVTRTHRKCFPGVNQILFWQDGGEKEAVLYTTENGEMVELQGYYIYYEENKTMQEYMIAHNPTNVDRVGEPDDHAVRDFRQVVERKHPTDRRGSGQILRIAAAACVVLAIAGAIRYMQNNRVTGKLTTEQSQVGRLWKQSAASEATQTTAGDSLTVETATGTSVTEENASEIAKSEISQEIPQTEETTTEDVQPEMSVISSAETKPDPGTDEEQQSETPDPQTEETKTEGYRTYQVQTGDTISSISQKYYGNMQMVRQICALNRIEKQDLIYTGQILLLP